MSKGNGHMTFVEGTNWRGGMASESVDGPWLYLEWPKFFQFGNSSWRLPSFHWTMILWLMNLYIYIIRVIDVHYIHMCVCDIYMYICDDKRMYDTYPSVYKGYGMSMCSIHSPMIFNNFTRCITNRHLSTGIWASAISFAPLPWVHHKCWRVQVWTIMWSILETHSINMFPYNSNHGVSSTLPCCSCFYRSFPSSLAMSFCEGEPWYPGKRWKWREQPADLGWLSCLGFFLLAQVRDDRKPWETCWSKLKSTFQRLKNLNAFRIIPSVDGCPEVWDLKWESMTKPCRFCNLDAQKVQATHGTMISMVNKNH